MKHKIHRSIIGRLLLVWLLLSASIGIALYLYEHGQVEHFALNLATKHAEAVTPEMIARIAQDDETIHLDLQTIADRFTRQQFAAVDVYDDHGAHLAASVRYDTAESKQAIENRHHQFPLDKAFHFENFAIDQQPYVQILLPLKSQDDVVGYFEGVYKIDQYTLDLINQRVFYTLCSVVFIILVTMLVIYPVIIRLNSALYRYSGNLLSANIELLEVLGGAISSRDNCTSEHNFRVTLYAAMLGEHMQLKEASMQRLIVGSFLHDVGKIGISDNVLHKKGALNEQETQIMRTHVTVGLDIVSKSKWLWEAREIIENHHEKFDGSGYGKGLVGKQIPLSARIFAIVDVFDALMSERPYKPAFSFDESISHIREQSGKHFDPEVVENFLTIARQAHRAVVNRSEQQLAAMLSVFFERYFFDSQMQEKARSEVQNMEVLATSLFFGSKVGR